METFYRQSIFMQASVGANIGDTLQRCPSFSSPLNNTTRFFSAGVVALIISRLFFKCTYSAVVANACCLPAAVVAAGVTLVQLETIVFVPAHVEQRDTKWPLPWKSRSHGCCGEKKQGSFQCCHYSGILPSALKLLPSVVETLHHWNTSNLTSKLCVGLFNVTQSSYQLFTGDGFLVLQQISMKRKRTTGLNWKVH